MTSVWEKVEASCLDPKRVCWAAKKSRWIMGSDASRCGYIRPWYRTVEKDASEVNCPMCLELGPPK